MQFDSIRNLFANAVERSARKSAGQGRHESANPPRARALVLESLETRELLSATPLEAASVSEVALASQETTPLDALDLSAVQTASEPASTVVTSLADVVDATDGVVTLREAITVYANDGDSVTFAPALKGGTIVLSGSQIVIDKAITVSARSLLDKTNGVPGITIDANSASRIFRVTGDTVWLDSIAFTGGNGGGAGGAIYAYQSTLTISNSTFQNNIGTYGGALYADSSTLTISNVRFQNNTVAAEGGGAAINAYRSTLTLLNSSFQNNTAYYGGAIYSSYSTTTISNTSFQSNTASGLGGGAIGAQVSTLNVSNATFRNNTAAYGGAFDLSSSALTLSNSTLTRNTALNASALYLTSANVCVFNATIYGNSASNSSSNRTIFVSANSHLDLHNTIVAGNSGADVYKADVRSVVSAYSVLSSYRGWTNADAVVFAYDSSKPLFTDAAQDDYTLAPGSQAINKGDDVYVYAEKDLAGNARVSFDAVDLGAYEYGNQLEAPKIKSSSSTHNTITVAWNAIANATGYVVAYKSPTDSAYIEAPATTSTTFTINNLAPETEYKVKVLAKGDGTDYSDSLYGSVKTVVTKVAPVDPTPLTVPTWKTSSSTYNSVTVAWNPVANASGYVVEYKGPTDTNYTVMSQTNATSVTVPNLAPETTYKLRVYAVGDGVNYSDSGYSSIKAVKTKVAPVDPTPLTVPTWKTSSSTHNSVTVAWNPVANASGYVVEYKGPTDTNYTVMSQTTATSVTVPNLAPETTYKLRVYAAGDGVNYSNSGYSTIKAVKTKVAPVDPTPLTVPTWKTTSSTYNSVTVAWNPVANASGYVVEYKSSTDSGYTVMPQTNATSITIPNLAAETTYKLRVYAAGDGVNYSDSGYSAVKAVKTKPAPATPEPASTVVTSLADTVNAYDNVVTLREAITVYANDGDTVTFAPALKGGTITLGGSEIEINKSIKIDASALWDATQNAPGVTIDANSQSRILYIAATDESGPIEVGIDSLAFAHGDAYLYYYQFGNDQYYYQNYSPYQYYPQCGGAILCVNRGAEPLLTISNSVFTENEGAAGAAIFFLAGSTLNISGSIFNNNGADDDGGAFFAQGARQTNVSDSIFEGNSSGNSGGAIVALDTTLNVAGTEFHDNSAWSGLAYENGGVGYGYGGAVMFEFGTLNVSNSVFYNNDSDAWGGAVNAANADVVIKNSTFTQNEAPLGSAISLHDQPFYWQEQYYYLNAKLFNVTISDNKTIPGNDSTGGSDDNRISGAIFFSGNVDTQLDVYNSIIAGNQNGDVRLDDNAEGSVNAHNVLTSFNDWSNGTAGVIGYDPSKPLFTNAAQGDYTLATGSQAINRGDNAYVTTQTDLAGAPRIIGGTVDLGAYESDTPAPSASLDAPTWKTTSSTYNSVTVAWNPVANASGYVVEYKGPNDTDYTVMSQTNATSITIPNLAEETTYKLRVYAAGDGVNYSDSGYSTIKAVKTKTAPVTPEPASTVVTSLADTIDAYDNVVTLREAITVYANDGDTITFAPALKGGTITLGGSEIEINKSIKIDSSALWDAPQDAPGITIDANSQSRILRVVATDESGPIEVEIDSLAFAHGNAMENDDYYMGGAILCVNWGDNPSLTISNSTFTGNIAGNGGGAIGALGSTLNISGSIFNDNDADGCGGAVYVDETYQINVSDSVFDGNGAGMDGGAIFAFGTILNVSNSTFDKNSASDNGGAICAEGVSLTVSNSTFAQNEARSGSAIYLNGYSEDPTDARLFNVTIYGNCASESSGGAIYARYSKCDVYNSIVAGNTNGDVRLDVNATGSVNAYKVLSSFNDWSNGTAGVIGYDPSKPLFTNAAQGDYTLATNSQAINRGDNTYVSTETDLAGAPRIIGGTVDLGAYESDTPAPSASLDVPTWKSTSSTTDSVTVAWNPVANALGYVVEYKGPNDVDYTVMPSTTATSITIPNLAEETTYKLRVYALGDWISYSDSGYSAVKAVKTKAAPVPEPASTVVTSLADVVDAFDNVVTLREAIAVYAYDGDTITFAPELKGGTITLGGSQIEIGKALTIDASALWDATQDAPGITIDANSQSRIFFLSGDTVEIDSLAFTGGSTGSYGGAIYASQSTLTISNSTFQNNSTAGYGEGGAIYAGSGTALTISNSTFQNNSTAHDGGAIYAIHSSTVTISNSTFQNNNSASSGDVGGAICAFYSTLSIYDSTFQNNTAGSGGAIRASGSTLTVSNSTFQNNTSFYVSVFGDGGSGGAILADSATLTISNSSFQNNTTKGSGGAIYATGNVTISTSSIFRNNSAGEDGNDIYCRGGNAENGYFNDLSKVQFVASVPGIDDVDAAPRPLGGVYIVHHAFNATATLTWAPFAGATSYSVYKATNGGPFMPAGSGLSETTCDVGVSVGVTYTIKVEALGNDGKVLARTTTSFTPIHTGAPLSVLDEAFADFFDEELFED